MEGFRRHLKMPRYEHCSPELRDLLLEHIDGPVPVQMKEPNRPQRVNGAVQSGLLSYDDGYIRPKATRITEKGRALLAHALGHWADAIMRANNSRKTPTS